MRLATAADLPRHVPTDCVRFDAVSLAEVPAGTCLTLLTRRGNLQLRVMPHCQVAISGGPLNNAVFCFSAQAEESLIVHHGESPALVRDGKPFRLPEILSIWVQQAA